MKPYIFLLLMIIPLLIDAADKRTNVIFKIRDDHNIQRLVKMKEKMREYVKLGKKKRKKVHRNLNH